LHIDRITSLHSIQPCSLIHSSTFTSYLSQAYSTLCTYSSTTHHHHPWTDAQLLGNTNKLCTKAQQGGRRYYTTVLLLMVHDQEPCNQPALTNVQSSGSISKKISGQDASHRPSIHHFIPSSKEIQITDNKQSDYGYCCYGCHGCHGCHYCHCCPCNYNFSSSKFLLMNGRLTPLCGVRS
jgi:hypothetical protein